MFKADFVEQAVRGAPAVGGSIWYGFTLNQWVGIATIGYIVIQALYLLRKWYREERDWRGRKRGHR